MNFIFIVGAPRSGTTWLQALLASHPRVITGQETHFFSAIKKFLSFYDERKDWRNIGLYAYWSKKDVSRLVRSYFLKFIEPVLSNSAEALFFVEKSPEHTVLMPFIAECFPEARFIHIIRDARHMVASLIRVSKRNNQYVSPTVASLVWRDFVSTGIAFGRQLPSEKYLELRYEDLRMNTLDLLSRIFTWLSLDCDQTLLSRIVEKCSLTKVKKSKKFDVIKSSSSEPNGFFAEGAIGQSFSLTKLELYRVYEICGSLLKELGYIRSVPKIPLWVRIAYSHKLRKLLRLREI